MKKPKPKYITLQPRIVELLEQEWDVRESEFWFNLYQIMHFTGVKADKKTYRKALAVLVETGKIFLRKSGVQRKAYQWCSALMMAKLETHKQKVRKDNGRTWMASQDLQQLHKTLLSRMGGFKSLRQSRQIGFLEDHAQDFWVKLLEIGFSTTPSLSKLTTWAVRNAYSSFRDWSQDLPLTISRNAVNDINRTQFTRVVVDYESYNNKDLGEARIPPLQETRIEGLELMEELRDEFLDAWRTEKIGERYFRMYAAQKLGYTAPEIGAFEGISGNRTSTILQHGRDYVKNRQNLLAAPNSIGKNQNDC